MSSFGVIGTEVAGHTALEASGVFGHNAEPPIYAVSSGGSDCVHNASRVDLWVSEVTGFRRDDPVVRMPCVSETYCDDGILFAMESRIYQM